MIKNKNKHQNLRISRFAYPNTHEFIQAMYRWDANNYRDNSNDSFYFRTGSYQLAVCEQKIGKLVDAENIVITTSGMSAFVTALEIASLTENDIVIHGTTEYGQIYNYITEDLPERRIRPIEVDAGNIDEIESVLKKLVKSELKDKIKVIFLETVGNGPDIPVLNLEKFLTLKILRQINPLIILDNTLPTNSVLQLAKKIRDSKLRIIGLESATKFYLLNQDLGGILFTYDEPLYQQLLTKRKRIGATPGISLIEAFKKLTPKIKEEFNNDNTKTMSNTFHLAQACNQAANKDKKFIVDYPNLPHHQNFNYVRKTYPKGCAPVFFIRSISPSVTSEELFYFLEKKGAFKDTVLTDSFGFYKTGASYASRNGGCIRIAGGLESSKQVKKLGDQFQNALLTL